MNNPSFKTGHHQKMLKVQSELLFYLALAKPDTECSFRIKTKQIKTFLKPFLKHGKIWLNNSKKYFHTSRNSNNSGNIHKPFPIRGMVEIREKRLFFPHPLLREKVEKLFCRREESESREKHVCFECKSNIYSRVVIDGSLLDARKGRKKKRKKNFFLRSAHPVSSAFISFT